MNVIIECSLLHNLEKNQLMAEMGVVREDLQRTVEMVQEKVILVIGMIKRIPGEHH